VPHLAVTTQYTSTFMQESSTAHIEIPSVPQGSRYRHKLVIILTCDRSYRILQPQIAIIRWLHQSQDNDTKLGSSPGGRKDTHTNIDTALELPSVQLWQLSIPGMDIVRETTHIEFPALIVDVGWSFNWANVLREERRVLVVHCIWWNT
jgi:hypothetical protein